MPHRSPRGTPTILFGSLKVWGIQRECDLYASPCILARSTAAIRFRPSSIDDLPLQ